MSEIAIRVENLSKLYKIGAVNERHDTLRDQIAEGFKTLFQRNGRLSSARHGEDMPAIISRRLYGRQLSRFDERRQLRRFDVAWPH